MTSPQNESGARRTEILSRIHTPYEELLVGAEPDSQYYLDLIKLKIALSTNLLSLEQVHKLGEELHKDAESVMSTFIPLYEPWSQEMIDRVIENLRYLMKHDVVNAKILDSAIYDVLGHKRPHRVPVGTEAEVLKYFARNPMRTFRDASLELSMHRSTVYEAYKKLESHHWARILGHNNVTGFGLQPIYFLFELNDHESWMQIESCVQAFPFTSRIHRYPNSETIVSAFLLPNSTENLREFKSGIKEMSDEFFSYSSLHLYEGSGRLMNPSLMQEGAWLLPKCITERNLDAKDSGGPFIGATERNEFMEDLTYVDFHLEEILCMNPRMKPSEAKTHLEAQGLDMPLRTISERRNLLIDRGILTPFLWFARLGFHYDIPVEVICNATVSDRLLNILASFPLVYLYFKSHRGMIFWLETPQAHLTDYLWFLNTVREMKGVKSVRSILAITYRGGRPNKDIMAGFEYGDEGFLISPSDVDITAHLE